MPRAFRVLWTITPRYYPQPWRNCSRCNRQTPFCCGGKFRLNANGKRLDAWLIYRCTVCDDTWNHAVVERRAARDLDPAMLAAFEANDEALVRRFALDVAVLRRSAHRVEEFPEVEVHRQPAEIPAGPTAMEITLAVPFAVSLRLDRLLATELGVSRGRIAALAEAGALTTATALNRPVRDGTTIIVSPPPQEVDLA